MGDQGIQAITGPGRFFWFSLPFFATIKTMIPPQKRERLPLSRPLSLTIASLLLVNLVPLFGVLILEWEIGPIMTLYWSENVVIGLFNILKMAQAKGEPGEIRKNLNSLIPRIILIFFFIVHYGMFTAVHGVFVWVLFGKRGMPPMELGIAVAALFLSHGYSYYRHFIRGGEVDRITPAQLLMQPYKRVLVMHLTIILGALAAKLLGAPPAALAVMVLLKTALDLYSHLKEHRSF